LGRDRDRHRYDGKGHENDTADELEPLCAVLLLSARLFGSYPPSACLFLLRGP